MIDEYDHDGKHICMYVLNPQYNSYLIIIAADGFYSSSSEQKVSFYLTPQTNESSLLFRNR